MNVGAEKIGVDERQQVFCSLHSIQEQAGDGEGEGWGNAGGQPHQSLPPHLCRLHRDAQRSRALRQAKRRQAVLQEGRVGRGGGQAEVRAGLATAATRSSAGNESKGEARLARVARRVAGRSR